VTIFSMRVASLLQMPMTLFSSSIAFMMFAPSQAATVAPNEHQNGDFLGGISSLSGAVSGYNSVTGGSSTSSLGSWSSTASNVAGVVSGATNGNYTGLVNAVGNAVGAGSTASTISSLWQSSGVAGDATNTWNAIQQARTAAVKNSPS